MRAKKPNCSSGCGWIGEPEPGVLMVLYDQYEGDPAAGGGFLLKVRKYRVSRL